MKFNFYAAAAAALLFASCTGNSTQNAGQAEETAVNATKTVSITGKWCIENIVLNDSTNVRPAEINPEQCQSITFGTDSTYSIITNCNSLQGRYIANADSLVFEAGQMTEMACDDMRSEDYLRQILPEVRTAEFENDSTLRLNTTGADQYIVLRKSTCDQAKCKAE